MDDAMEQVEQTKRDARESFDGFVSGAGADMKKQIEQTEREARESFDAFVTSIRKDVEESEHARNIRAARLETYRRMRCR